MLTWYHIKVFVSRWLVNLISSQKLVEHAAFPNELDYWCFPFLGKITIHGEASHLIPGFPSNTRCWDILLDLSKIFQYPHQMLILGPARPVNDVFATAVNGIWRQSRCRRNIWWRKRGDIRVPTIPWIPGGIEISLSLSGVVWSPSAPLSIRLEIASWRFNARCVAGNVRACGVGHQRYKLISPK